MSSVRGFLTLIAVLAVAGGGVAAIRQRDHNKQVMFAIYADLHNLATSQQAHFADNATYALDVSMNGFRPTHGATVQIIRADSTSWEATATHPETKLICTTSFKKGVNWAPPVCK